MVIEEASKNEPEQERGQQESRFAITLKIYSDVLEVCWETELLGRLGARSGHARIFNHPPLSDFQAGNKALPLAAI